MDVYLVSFYGPWEDGCTYKWKMDEVFWTKEQAQRYIDHHTPAWSEDSKIVTLYVRGD